VIGKQTSASVSLVQRIEITAVAPSGDNGWQISGFARPYNQKELLLVQQRTACGQWSTAWSVHWGSAQTGSNNPTFFYSTGIHTSGGGVYRLQLLPAPNPYYSKPERAIATSSQVVA
jgi:hypothetical protein